MSECTMMAAGNSAPCSADTQHAPAERLSLSEVMVTADVLAWDPVVQTLLEGHPEFAAILTPERQIAACNESLLRLLGVSDRATVVGRRFGEVVECTSAWESSGGCGTTASCRFCGAVNVVTECLSSGRQVRGECQLLRQASGGMEAVDLEVVATQLDIGRKRLVIFAGRDVSAERRRDVLERLFYHDVIRAGGSLEGYAQIALDDPEMDVRECLHRVREIAVDLVEQIRSQRDLTAAERGELQPHLECVLVSTLFEELRSRMAAHPGAGQRGLNMEMPSVEGLAVYSDPVLLRRVLASLIANALEAIAPGQKVTVVAVADDADRVRISVHNPGEMTDQARAQVFRRSCSTKGGSGRGLGTYSVKLLVSQILEGTVGFTSEAKAGTEFVVTIPRY